MQDDQIDMPIDGRLECTLNRVKAGFGCQTSFTRAQLAAVGERLIEPQPTEFQDFKIA